MSIRKFDHNLTRRNFRRAKHALAYGAVALVGVFSATVPLFSANAQTITLQTDCSKYQPNVIGADGICAAEQKRLAVQANALAHQREQKLDQEIAAEDALKACLAQLVTYKKQNPEEFARLGRITRENACDISGKIPKPTAAAARPAAG